MKRGARLDHHGRWMLPFLVAVVAVLATLLSSASASAATQGVAETRVRASSVTVLTTTEDHPYWSVDDQRFERADELSDGERVLGADGRTIKVSGLRLATTRDGLAYNLSVEGIHTYHVGVDEILVHNTCKWVPKKPGYTEHKVGLPSAEAAEEAARDAAAVGAGADSGASVGVEITTTSTTSTTTASSSTPPCSVSRLARTGNDR